MPRRHHSEDKIFLLHPTRRYIYKIICENPGTYFYKLMSHGTEKDSSATLLYHLTKLVDDGLIKSDKIDGKRLFFPKNLRTKEVERAYMLLKNKNAMKIFLHILNNKNCFQNEIARELKIHHDSVRHHAVRLVDAELIMKEKKGKRVHFQIGRLGEEILEGSLTVFSEAYVRFIISKFADDCHFPEIISRTAEQLTIRVVCPNEDDIELTIDISGWDIEIPEGHSDNSDEIISEKFNSDDSEEKQEA